MPPWLKAAGWVAGALACVYGAVCADVVLRARFAYREGERYMRWHSHPEEKRAHFESEFRKKKAALEAQRGKGSLSPEEFRHRLELAEFERDETARESSVKYAFIWFQTAVELFRPPESRWVRLARERLPQARALWRAELEAVGLRVEDSMLE